jgi:hypothetical protein
MLLVLVIKVDYPMLLIDKTKQVIVKIVLYYYISHLVLLLYFHLHNSRCYYSSSSLLLSSLLASPPICSSKFSICSSILKSSVSDLVTLASSKLISINLGLYAGEL